MDLFVKENNLTFEPRTKIER